MFNEKLENIKKYVIKNNKIINANIKNIKNNNFNTKLVVLFLSSFILSTIDVKITAIKVIKNINISVCLVTTLNGSK